MRKQNGEDVMIYFRDLIIVITIVIILLIRVIICLHSGYFTPVFVLQEFFFGFLILVSYTVIRINNRNITIYNFFYFYFDRNRFVEKSYDRVFRISKNLTVEKDSIFFILVY